MGLTTFKGEYPTLADAKIAKNYLKEDELKILNNLVSGYFDFAEIQAMKRRPMYMSDYIQQLNNILSSTGEPLLTSAGGFLQFVTSHVTLSNFPCYKFFAPPKKKCGLFLFGGLRGWVLAQAFGRKKRRVTFS